MLCIFLWHLFLERAVCMGLIIRISQVLPHQNNCLEPHFIKHGERAAGHGTANGNRWELFAIHIINMVRHGIPIIIKDFFTLLPAYDFMERTGGSHHRYCFRPFNFNQLQRFLGVNRHKCVWPYARLNQWFQRRIHRQNKSSILRLLQFMDILIQGRSCRHQDCRPVHRDCLGQAFCVVAIANIFHVLQHIVCKMRRKLPLRIFIHHNTFHLPV